MNKMLSSMFAEAKAPEIDWEGEPLYGIYEIDPAPEGLIVEFVSATTAPIQGLTLKAYGGTLMVNDIEAQEILLWRDTAPNIIPVLVKSESGTKVTLKIWNIWRGLMGDGVSVTQAWLGNAGMRIQLSDNKKEVFFRCSDGEGPIDFGDLEVRVIIS
jgi:hypothetical protein